MHRNSIKMTSIGLDWPDNKDIMLDSIQGLIDKIQAGTLKHSLVIAVAWWNRFDKSSQEGYYWHIARCPNWIIKAI